MIDFLPTLYNKPVGLKIFTVLLLIAVSLLFSVILGIIIAIPFLDLILLLRLGNLNDFNDHETVAILKYFQVVNQLGIFIIPAIAYAYLENRKPINYLRAGKKPDLLFLLLSILLIVVSIPAINWMVTLNEAMRLPEILKPIEDWMRDSERDASLLTEAFLNVNTISGLLVNLFIIALVAALGEELLFRGVILRILIEWTKNIHSAVIFSAILFSALHLQFFGFFPRMVLGILFGYVYVWSGSIWIPIILHLLFNGITVIGAYLYQLGKIQTDVETLGSTSNDIVIISSFALIPAFLYIIFRFRKRNNSLDYNSETGYSE
ncbi:MAG: CPBP family intramembrane glutamic endopeptidase [Bacteroidales bacterium]